MPSPLASANPWGFPLGENLGQPLPVLGGVLGRLPWGVFGKFCEVLGVSWPHPWGILKRPPCRNLGEASQIASGFSASASSLGSPGGALHGLLKFKPKPGGIFWRLRWGMLLDVYVFCLAKSWGEGSSLLWGRPRLPWGVFAEVVFGASLGRWTCMLACLCACCSLPRLSP